MDNNLLTPAQLASHLSAQPAGSGLLTPSQLASYATKSTPSNPSSNVGSSWDAYDKSMSGDQGNKPQEPSLMDRVSNAADEFAGGPLSGALKMGVDNIKSTLMPSLQSFFSGLAGVGHGLYKDVTAQNPQDRQSAADESGASGLKVTAGAGSVVASPLSVIMNALSKIPTPTGQNIAGGSGANLGDAIHNTYVQPIADIISNNPQLQSLVTQHPNLEQDIPNFISTLLLLGGVEKSPEIKATAENTVNTVANTADTVAGKAQPIIDKVSDKVNDLVNPPPAPLNETAIIDKYNRAIKPTVGGKSSAADIAQGNTKVISGIKAIADNKTNLSFTDADGNTITGQTPKSVDQFSQSIDQTKQSIYKQYNDLAVKAGEKGITVDPTIIAKELDPVINSKSLEIANPKAVQYAKDLQARLNKTGEIDAPTAQEVIQHYNTALKAFYRNPTYDTASTASIDSMIANKFRSELDNGITGATGEQYQALKNQYGSLASMEKDVTHRNVVWGRQNNVGFSANIANVASGAELLRGLMTMNPADIAVSGGIKAIQMYAKYLNNPDVGVSKIFSEIERANQPSKGSVSVSATEGIKSSSYPKDNTMPEKVNSDVKPEQLKPLADIWSKANKK